MKLTLVCDDGGYLELRSCESWSVLLGMALWVHLEVFALRGYAGSYFTFFLIPCYCYTVLSDIFNVPSLRLAVFRCISCAKGFQLLCDPGLDGLVARPPFLFFDGTASFFK